MSQVLLKITGRVQGVFYRAHTQEAASRLGLTGYTRNMPNGTVEVLVQGPRDQIEAFIELCREGSPSATVENIEVIWQEPSEKLQKFEIQ